MRLMIVDSDLPYSDAMASHLKSANFDVDQARCIFEFETLSAPPVHDLYFIDKTLSDGDGFQLIAKMRKYGCRTPIMIVSNLSSVRDRVAGLELGADDYLPKPVSASELVARTKALLRRPPLMESLRITAGKLAMDCENRTFTLDGRTLNLSPGERRLLEVLMRRLGRVVPRETLANSVQGASSDATPNALEQQISRLRRAIVDTAGLQLVTVRGAGYVLQEHRIN